MKSGMTRAEHNVAAALMKQTYDWRDHTYFHPADIDMPVLDADTLEPIDISTVFARRRAVNSEEIGCDDGPFTLAPAS